MSLIKKKLNFKDEVAVNQRRIEVARLARKISKLSEELSDTANELLGEIEYGRAADGRQCER